MFDLRAILDDQSDDPLDLVAQYVNPSFARVLKILGYDVNYVRGSGAYLWDDQGNRYIDCISGFGVFACGRNHPTIRKALRQAMELDLPNLVKFGPPRLSGMLAQQLVKMAPGELDTVYFCNSGAEGIEAAIKYARAATGRARIVYCNKAYHGLTMGALSINGGDEFRERFGPLLAHCTPIPFNDLEALEQALSPGDVAGFIVEPIQGKGVHLPDDTFLPAAAELCHKHKTLFIADEVQTGYGRTGKMFACEHWDAAPDIMVTAKALSGGYVPVGAVLSKRWIHEAVFSSLDRCMVHSTTFGQNDLAMAAGLASLHVLLEEQLVQNAAAMGKRLLAKLKALVNRHEMLEEVRGKGLLIALEFAPPLSMKLKLGWSLLHKLDRGLFPQAVLIPLLRDHYVLAQVAGHHQDVIKLIPPLVLSEDDVDHITAALDATISACHKFGGPIWEVGKRLSGQALRGATEPAGV